MAAFPKPDRFSTGGHSIGAGSFRRVEKACENPPRASDALKAFVAEGLKALKRD